VGNPDTDPNVPGTGATQTINRQSGQFGRISSFTILNATANFSLPRERLTFFITVKNLTDRVYIADRTRGILPGAPRLVQVGARWDF
jgi:Fe(3+) dicitrate transport protein